MTIAMNACEPAIAGARFVRPMKVGGVLQREQWIRGGVRSAPHGHTEGFATLVLGGHAVEEYRGRTRLLSAGYASFNSPGQEHELRTGDAGLHVFEVVFRAEFWPVAGLREPGASPRGLAPSAGSRVLRRLLTEYRLGAGSSPLAIEALAQEFADAVANGGGASTSSKAFGSRRWLSRVVEQLNYAHGPTPSLSALARTHGVHPSHLARTFRARFGCTIGEYLRRRRVGRACQALRERDTPLAQLAFELGFSDQAHFCRVFKQTVGASPGRYRRFVRSLYGRRP